MEAVLQSDVLVLNRLFVPIHVTNVRRAFSQLYEGTARAVDAEYRTFDFETWSELSQELADGGAHETVGTVKQKLLVPRVIQLVAFELRPKHRVRFSRLNIYARDGSTCQYCGRRFSRSELNLDHVIPRSRGGRTTWENIVCSCIPCNLKKGGNTPEEAGMKLLKRPAQPRWNPVFRSPVRRLYREWLPFISVADVAYWNVELREE